MRWKLCLAGIFILATASLGATGVRLRYKLAHGQVLHYHEKIEGTGEWVNPSLSPEPIPLQLTGTVDREWRVERVGQGPSFGIESRVTASKLEGKIGTAEPEEMTYPPAHLWLQMTDTGKIAQVWPHPLGSPPVEPLNFLGLPLDLNALAHGLLTVELPERRAEKGSTWLEEEIPLPAGNGSEAEKVARLHTRFQELKTHQGQNCAEIDAGFESPIEAFNRWEGIPVAVKGRIRGAMILHFALERGVVIHTEGTLELEWTVTEADSGGPASPEATSVKMTLKLETNLVDSPLKRRPSNPQGKGITS